MSEVAATPAALLQVVGLQKTFVSPGGDIRVLAGVDMQVAECEFVAIVGQSGSGKSTLLHILGTLESADAGDVRLDGKSLFGMSDSDMAAMRNRSIGFVYQAHHLIPELTALENVMMPLLVRGESAAKSAGRAEDLLGRLGLKGRMTHRPGKLSGGEAQRVAVARSLVGKPSLLLADEPTGNLDEHTAKDVFLAMRQLCREERAAAVMVTHSRYLADTCDRQLLLHNGTIDN
ncbi:MAG: ABC transporter ATP-binding protein [Mariprofundaceae bacterium]|nr:ABC transporter ATP-binding protein [Mariprofundaceae bacterium]